MSEDEQPRTPAFLASPAAKSEVHLITGASTSLSADIRARQTRYVISMSVRTACVILAVVTGGWLRLVFFAGAVALPYFAVVVANAGRAHPLKDADLLPPPVLPAIGPPPDPTVGRSGA